MKKVKYNQHAIGSVHGSVRFVTKSSVFLFPFHFHFHPVLGRFSVRIGLLELLQGPLDDLADNDDKNNAEHLESRPHEKHHHLKTAIL